LHRRGRPHPPNRRRALASPPRYTSALGLRDYLGDHLGATAFVDRLLHHSHVIVINGPSYRDWEDKQDIGTSDVCCARLSRWAHNVVAGAALVGGTVLLSYELTRAQIVCGTLQLAIEERHRRDKLLTR
jgi:hypothetical protein